MARQLPGCPTQWKQRVKVEPSINKLAYFFKYYMDYKLKQYSKEGSFSPFSFTYVASICYKSHHQVLKSLQIHSYSVFT